MLITKVEVAVAKAKVKGAAVPKAKAKSAASDTRRGSVGHEESRSQMLARFGMGPGSTKAFPYTGKKGMEAAKKAAWKWVAARKAAAA